MSCLDDQRWSYQDLGHLLHPEWGVVGVIISVAADDGCQDGLPCVPKSSWGILGQLDTRGLSQGIPDLEEPKTWCHWNFQMQWQCCTLLWCIVCGDDNCLFYSSWVGLGWCWYWNCNLFDSESSLVDWWSERKCFMYYNGSFVESSGNCIYTKTVWLVWSDPFYISVSIICNISSWNPSKSLDFHSIFADFTLVYCEICGFQLNPQYLQYFNLNLQYCKLNVSDCCVSPLL